MNKFSTFITIVFTKHTMGAYLFANIASSFVLFLMAGFEAAMAAGFAIPLYLIPAIIAFSALHKYKPKRLFKHVVFAVLMLPFPLYLGITTLIIYLSENGGEVYMWIFMFFLPALVAGLTAYTFLLISISKENRYPPARI